jgi:cytochrome b561
VRIRNDEREYGLVTVYLHWFTVLLLLAQFVLGYAMESLGEFFLGEMDSLGQGRGDGDERLVFAHAWLGSAILLLALVRIGWRLATPLPPWDERLTEGDRRVERLVELVLYWLLVLTPASGLGLLFLSGEEREVATGEWIPPYDVVGDDLLLVLHVACHVALYVTLAVHVAIAVRRRTIGRIV